jgi:cytidylate kinase
MIRVVTVAREYGSGGGEIAALAARRLGWDLVDKSLINAVAEKIHIGENVVTQLQGRASWWMERIARAVWLETGGTAVDLVDTENVHEFTVEAIREAGDRGNCVIVGRGAQCVLRDLTDALHVFVFAPMEYRMRRLGSRYPNRKELVAAITRVDEERAAYIKEFHDADWKDPALYHLWINGSRGVEAAVEKIVNAVNGSN